MRRLALALALLVTPGCGTFVMRDLAGHPASFGGVVLDVGFPAAAPRSDLARR